MLPVERHRFITEVLSQRGRVMVQEVAQLCHISIETARRDWPCWNGAACCCAATAARCSSSRRRWKNLCARRDRPGNLSASAATRRRSRKRASPNARWNLSRRGIVCCWTAAPPAGFGAPTAGYLAGGIDQLAAHHQTLACKANVRTIGLGASIPPSTRISSACWRSRC